MGDKINLYTKCPGSHQVILLQIMLLLCLFLHSHEKGSLTAMANETLVDRCKKQSTDPMFLQDSGMKVLLKWK